MFIKDKWKPHLSPRSLLITGVLLTMMAVSTAYVLAAAATNQLTIYDNGSTLTLTTKKNTISKALKEANIVLAPADEMDVEMKAPVCSTKIVNIKRAFTVNIQDQDKAYSILTAKSTVGEALTAADVTLGEFDEVEPAIDQPLTPDGTILLTRVCYAEKTVAEDISYDTIRENSLALTRGNTKVTQEGQNGTAEVTYRVTIKNGIEAAAQKIAEKIIKEPLNKVIAVGTRMPDPLVKLSSRGDEFRYKKAITCVATAYDGSYATLGKSNPRTALGKTPTVGTVAVDTSIFPLGTRLYIESADGGKSWVYGYCFAGDTGVRGNHVDLFKASRSEALAFGRRNAIVYILD